MNKYRRCFIPLISFLLVFLLLFTACSYTEESEDSFTPSDSPLISNDTSEHDAFLESVDELLNPNNQSTETEEVPPTETDPESNSPVTSPQDESTVTTPENNTVTNEQTNSAETKPETKKEFSIDVSKIAFVAYSVADEAVEGKKSENHTAIKNFLNEMTAAIKTAEEAKPTTKDGYTVILRFYDDSSQLLLYVQMTPTYKIIYRFPNEKEQAFHLSKSAFEKLESLAPTPDHLGQLGPTPPHSDNQFSQLDINGKAVNTTNEKISSLLRLIKRACKYGRIPEDDPSEITDDQIIIVFSDEVDYLRITFYNYSGNVKILRWETANEEHHLKISVKQFNEISSFVSKMLSEQQ